MMADGRVRRHVDELEQSDPRFARSPDGRLKSNFMAGDRQGAEWVRAYDTYLDKMRDDAAAWRRDGDLPAAMRAENQLAWERADRRSTNSSRARDRAHDPTDKQRFQERMLEADGDAHLAQQRQYEADATHQSRWHDVRQRLEPQPRQSPLKDQTDRQARENAGKPLRERLQGQELAHYDASREAFNKAMTAHQVQLVQSRGPYLDHPGASQDFDQRYEEMLRLRAMARQGEREAAPQAAQPVQKQAGQEQPKEQERQQADGQAHGQRQDEQLHAQASERKGQSPLLKQHEGFRATVANDQKSIAYRREGSAEPAFVDKGERVSIAARDQQALRAALRHAGEKFERFELRGARESREATARMAARMGLGDKVANEDLQDVIRQEREQIAREKAQQAAAEKATREPREVMREAAQSHGDTPSATRSAGESDSAHTLRAQSVSAQAPQTHSTDAQRDSAGQRTRQPQPQSHVASSVDDIPKPPGYDEMKAARAQEQGAKETQPKEKRPGVSPEAMAASAPRARAAVQRA